MIEALNSVLKESEGPIARARRDQADSDFATNRAGDEPKKQVDATKTVSDETWLSKMSSQLRWVEVVR